MKYGCILWHGRTLKTSSSVTQRHILCFIYIKCPDQAARSMQLLRAGSEVRNRGELLMGMEFLWGVMRHANVRSWWRHSYVTILKSVVCIRCVLHLNNTVDKQLFCGCQWNAEASGCASWTLLFHRWLWGCHVREKPSGRVAGAPASLPVPRGPDPLLDSACRL